jgi:putative membrane protein
MMWGYGNMFGWGLGGWFMMIIFWGAIIALVIWVVRGFGGRGSYNKSAREILEERYAKGEIEKKEFEAKKKDLES